LAPILYFSLACTVILHFTAGLQKLCIIIFPLSFPAGFFFFVCLNFKKYNFLKQQKKGK